MNKNDLLNISIVIPCYNEEETLPLLFDRIEDIDILAKIKYKFNYNFIFVDDGSQDDTNRLLNIFRNDHPEISVEILKKTMNGGFGDALKTGLKAAQDDIIVTIDADTNYDHREIPKLVNSFLNDPDLKIVTASPFAPGGEWNYPWYRFITSMIVVKFYHFALKGKGRDIHTFTCGFRGYKKDIIIEIMPEANDFLATAELLVRGILKRFKIREFPTANFDRRYGKSKLNTLKTAISHLKFIWKLYRNKV